MLDTQSNMILDNEDITNLNVVLTQIIDNARAHSILLINKSGRLITSQCENSEYDRTALAALISGGFASSNQIANIIGETEFSATYQEGKENHIYVTLVDKNTILSAIFNKRTTVNRVRKVINTYKPDLAEILQEIYSRFDSDPDVNLDVG